MILKAIMVLATGFALIYALRVKETYARILNWTMVIAIAITFIQIPQIISDGYYLYALTQLATVVYGLSNSTFTPLKKITLVATGLLCVVPTGMFLSGSAWALEIGFFAAIVQLLFGGWAAKKDIQSFREELGFLIILTADALVRIIGGIMTFTA